MSKGKPVDQAEPTIKLPTTTDAQKVAVAHATTASMPSSPLWATSPDVQAAAKAWDQSATNLDANVVVIAGLKNQLKTAEAKQLTLRRSWRVAKRQVLSTVSIACGGSADEVKGFSLEVITRGTASLLVAPEGLTSSPGDSVGQASIRWTLGLAKHGFLVQHATDSANAATYSPQLACTKTKYTLGGLTPSGSTVYFRVAAVDPLASTGQSPWSAWVACTAR